MGRCFPPFLRKVNPEEQKIITAKTAQAYAGHGSIVNIDNLKTSGNGSH